MASDDQILQFMQQLIPVEQQKQQSAKVINNTLTQLVATRENELKQKQAENKKKCSYL